MDPYSWTFVRGDRDEEQLTIVREVLHDANVRLFVTTNGSTRVIEFTDLAAAVRFQCDMEAFLIKSGWSFTAFAPERRSGRDRRELPRLFERRRWWTDGMTTTSQLLDWLDARQRSQK